MMDTTSSEAPDTGGGDLSPGDRVVILQGDWGSRTGVVLHPDPEYYHWGVWVLLVDNGDRIAISAYSLWRSIYQNEPLEEVPSV